MSAALVIALALGVGASMTMLTVIRVMSWDPLPGRSEHLFHPHIDPLPSFYDVKQSRDPRISLTWVDARELLSKGPAKLQVALASGRLLVNTQDGVAAPFFVDGQYATPAVFQIFGMNVKQGRGWTEEEENKRSRVVVISESLGARIGGTGQAVGRQVLLDGQSFRVIGVIADWIPRPRFHTDLQQNSFSGGDEFFIPLQTAIDLQLKVSSSIFSWSATSAVSPMQDPSTSWLQFWIFLDNPQERASYLRFIDNYAKEQISSGRFERRTPARLDSLQEFMISRKVIPAEVKLQMALAIAFFVVCLVNMCALLFARFMKRTHEVAIRRALGARRKDIMLQLCTEAFIIGTLGGLAGLLVAQAGLYLVRTQPEDYAGLAVMDWPMLCLTIVLACVSSLMAAFLPAMRAASAHIAMQMKSAE